MFGGRLRPFNIVALVTPLVSLADTARLDVVLLHSRREVTNAKFFCQSSVAEVFAGTVKTRPLCSLLVGEKNLFVLVFDGKIADMVGY